MKVWVIGRNVPAAWNNMTGVFELEQAKMLAAHGVEVVYPVVDLFSLRHRRPLGIRKREEDGVRIMQLSLPIGRAKRLLPDRMVDGIYRAFYGPPLPLRGLGRRPSGESGCLYSSRRLFGRLILLPVPV